jgi:Ser/Thr protein kinase RdoA (MazF antagonist)
MIMLESTTLQRIFQFFGLDPMDWHCVSFGTGLINSTWILRDNQGNIKYILQKINHQVFKRPEDIAHNLETVGQHLARLHPDYLFVRPVAALSGSTYFPCQGDYYRLFPFVKGSRTLDVVNKPEQAFEAAWSFARFSHLLEDLNPSMIKETLPHFHDLGLRFEQFSEALSKADAELLQQAEVEINFIEKHAGYVDVFKKLKLSGEFPVRIMHHDTKISNILFDAYDKALCVIDLDTVMPGYFISDVGDMMRTYLPPVSEEEKNLDLVVARPEYFKAIVAGYLSGMSGGLTSLEQQQFLFAGRFMIYMQAIRFLADFLQRDKYYGARYEGHNLIRARNQIRLLESFNQQEGRFQTILEETMVSS